MPTYYSGGGTSFHDFAFGIVGLLNNVIVPVIIALIFLVFLWGVANAFILHADDERARAGGRQIALWGLIGLFIVFSVWGIVNLLLSTIGIIPGR